MADDLGDLGVPANAKPSKLRNEAQGDLGVPAAAEVKPEERSILEPALGRDYLANSPDDGMVSSALKLAGTAISRAPFAPVGLIGDVRDLGRYVVDRAASKITGTPLEELQTRNKAKLEKERENEPSWMKYLPGRIIDRAPTTRELSDTFLKQAGTKPYEPTSLPGKIAMGAIEAGTGSMMSMGQGAARGAAQKLLPEIAEQTALKTAPAAAVAGAAGTTAAELTGDPLAGIVAAPVAAASAAKVGSLVHDAVPTVTKGGQQRTADQQLRDIATNPDRVAFGEQYDPLGVPTTTGATHGDQGLLQAEKLVAGVDPKFQSAQKDIQAKQNQVRVKTIDDLANPAANPKDVADHFVNHLEALDAHHSAVVANAEKQAASIANTLPEGQAIDQLGTRLQDVTNPRMKAAREMRSRAYDAIDPEGTMHIVATAGNAAKKMIEDFDPAVSTWSPTVKPIVDMVANLRGVMPFKSMMQLDTTINGALGQAQRSGDHAAVMQLGELKRAVKSDVSNALENQVKWEQQQVANGALKQENTIGYRLAEEARAFRDARRSAGTSAAVAGTGTTGAVRGVPGAQGSADAGSAVPTRPQGVEGSSTPNMDPGAAVQWQRAKELHGDFADTYRQGIVGKGLENEFGRFTQQGSTVANKAFVPGDAGGENVRSWLRAGGSDAQAVIEDIAGTRLREMMKGSDGLTPEVLQAWKTKYGPALNEMPDFAKRFDNAAAATQALGDATAAREAALSDYQKGIAKRFLTAGGTDDVHSSLGSMLSKGDSQAQFQQLKAATATNPEAWEGVKKGVADVLLGRVSNAAILGGENIMSGAKMPKLVRERAGTLKEIFGDEGYNNIVKVVDDLERSNAAQTLTSEVNSNTAMKLKPVLDAMAKQGAAEQSWLTMMLVGGQVAALSGNPLHALAVLPVMVAKHAWNKLNTMGVKSTQDLVSQGLLYPEVGRAMVQRAINADGTPNMAALAKLISALEATRGNDLIEAADRREGRASGGAVRDPSSHAMTLVREAEKIRKQHGEKTEALLKLPDEHVARALAVANEAIHGQ